MFKKLKTKTIIIGSVILMALVLLIGTTFAYFTARVVGNDTAKTTQVYAGIMSLRLNGNTQVSCDNLYPGGQCNITFSVENTGTLPTSYSLDIIDVTNNFANKSDLVYSITSNNKGGAKTETEAPSSNGTLIPVIAIEPGITQSYTLTLTFKETGENQNVNSNKTFTGKVQISSLDSNNYLASKIVMNNKYYGSDPQYNTRSISLSSASNANTWTNQYPTAEEFVHGSVDIVLSDINMNRTHSSSISGDKVLATGYELYLSNGSTQKMAVLTGVETNQTFDENAVGKYYCTSNAAAHPATTNTTCRFLAKILSVETSDKTHDYSEGEATEDTTSLTSNADKLVGTGYTFNEDTGIYTITNTISNVTYSSEHINYYTCNTNENTCDTIYQIKEVSGESIVTSMKSSIIANKNKARVKIYRVSNKSKNDGVYSTEDEEGISYYLRGNVENNYVKFGNYQTTVYTGVYSSNFSSPNYPGIYPYKTYSSLEACQNAPDYNFNCKKRYQQGDPIIWQVVRINGNGSIRLMAVDDIASSDFNSFYGLKSAGYTYDNERLCTKNNPCTSNTGVSSHIKTQLENWYQNEIINANLDNKVEDEYYCNDTTKVDQVTYQESSADGYYSSYERIRTGTPSLKCNNPIDTYGGLYKLKIGLISADEMSYAGLGWYNFYNSYLNTRDAEDQIYWYMSPLYLYESQESIQSGFRGKINYNGGSRNIGFYYDDQGVYPVINLKSDVTISGGDGTQDHPYIIQ